LQTLFIKFVRNRYFFSNLYIYYMQPLLYRWLTRYFTVLTSSGTIAAHMTINFTDRKTAYRGKR